MKDLQKRIQAIKSSEEIGVKYMQAWEEKLYAREEGRQEGREEGLILKDILLVCKKLQKGWNAQQIAELLEEDEASVEKICEIAQKYEPEYDVEKILAEVTGKTE